MRSNWLAGKPVNPFLPVILLILACLFDFATTYFESSTSLKWEEVAVGELMAALLIVLWAGIWAIAGRIIRHQHQFGRQIIATLLIVTGCVSLGREVQILHIEWGPIGKTGKPNSVNRPEPQ